MRKRLETCWATADDPRSTRVGRIIRKLRIDELADHQCAQG
ncbi:MAG: sugar transferase [Nitrosomonas sp.]|nr:sugar transferase [Nitrosomonas sp.]